MLSDLISNIVADIEKGDNLNESDNTIDSGMLYEYMARNIRQILYLPYKIQ